MAHSTHEDEDVRLFDHSDSELPPLPPDDDESFLRPPSDLADGSQLGSNDGNSLMEREMNRKLLDIESSFMPDAEPPSSTDDRSKGADDTYVFGAVPKDATAKEQDNGTTAPKTASPHAEDKALPDTPPTAPDALKTPAPDREADEHSFEHYDDSHMGDDSFEAPTPSSPAAAAAARSNSRPIQQNESGIETGAAEEFHEDDTQSARPTSSASTVKAALEGNGSADQAEGVKRPWGNSLNSNTSTLRTSTSSTNLRPRASFLRDRSRQASYRSSTSSTGAPGSAADVQDSTLTSDFALQSGGALPNSSSRHSLGDLSRLPSLGSVASSLSALSDEGTSRGVSAMDVNLDPLDEEPRAGSASPPVTPRPGTAGTNAPTDTVITKHVQNILVPDTIAKEYREKHGERSPDKRASTASFAFSSRTKHNLTLKEQNFKIDKLSKENFDLKLKIHFLDQALQNRSDEGVKDMISKNVQLQTDLANEKKETQSLKRKVRELERKVKAQEEGMAKNKAPGTGSDDDRSDGERIQQEMEEEITYLRECLQNSEVEIERLRDDSLAKEVEKRRMAEYVKSMGDRKNSEPKAGVEEAMEMWKDLLEAETARREQADEDAERLREEVRRLKAEREQPTTTNVRNNYNASRQSRVSYARSQSSEGTADNRASTSLSGVTLTEQLKHENAELRRDLGAQTSMLVSRNRERERLQQEIEELKLSLRRGAGGSVIGDSIFERSISRANQRPTSQSSAVARTELDDSERDEYEQKQAQLRDEIASVKMQNQELDRELNNHIDLLEAKEEELDQMREERNLTIEDMQALQADRDEALQALQEKDDECENLREEALGEIQHLEQEVNQKEQELDKLLTELENRNEDFDALQQEMKNVSESLIMLEDARTANERKIQSLEQELEDANNELEAMDQKLNEAQQKLERFEVQQESNQAEISFLREEQEGDKIKIGDLEAALNQAQMSIQEEKERMKDLEDRFQEERTQREALDSQEKESVQKAFDDLNGQASKARDEVRRLRKSLSTKEVEAAQWKQRLDDLETSLREALGSLDGTKHSLLKDVQKLQRDLDGTLLELNDAKSELADKERTLRNRDTLLESTSLESRKLADMLDKERQARMQDKREYEKAQRSHQTTQRSAQSYESRVLELETSRSQERRRIATLEAQYRDQLLERNNLLLAIWNRCSTLCGPEWSQRNSLVNGELPSLEVIGRHLPAFSKNILSAVKNLEAILGGFKSRIRGIEKDLWKEYQALEHKLEVRTKHLDSIEKTIRAGSIGFVRNEGLNQELSRLKSENKMLRSELQGSGPLHRHSTRNSMDSASQLATPQRNASGTSHSNRNSIASTLLRHNSASSDRDRDSKALPPTSQPSSLQPTEQRWIHRLKELERRLKAEREARLLDRRGARERLEEGRNENEELRNMLERERERYGGSPSGRSSPSHAEYPTIGTR